MSRRRAAKASTRAPAAPVGAGAAVVPHQVTRGYVETGAWDDPTDTGRRNSTNVRLVHGFRRADPLITLHRRSPHEVTERHLRAAERLRDDHEIGEGVRGVGRGAGGGVGPTDAQLDGLTRYREAVAAVGQSQCAILLPVVLAGWTVKRWVESKGPATDSNSRVLYDRRGQPLPAMTEQKAAGYLIAALDRLHEHYNPPVANRA